MRGSIVHGRIGRVGAALFCLTTGHATARTPQGDDDHALAMLVRSMQSDFRANVLATLLQRDHRGSNLFETIKMVRSRSGKQHWTVVAPLSRVGVECVDDGRRLRTYMRDECVLIDQESPARDREDLRVRVRLARHNYAFRTEAHGTIAGREVLCITALPRNGRCDGRRYCLDVATAYPLRMETVSPSGTVTMVYDTKDVQYPAKLSDELFELPTLPGVRRLTYDRPRSLSAREAEIRLGFRPVCPDRPQELPLGFHVEDMQYSGTDDWKSVVVRLTDGLARASVYEWLPSRTPKRPMPDSTPGESRGIKFLLVSDNLSPDLRRALLDAFLSGR